MKKNVILTLGALAMFFTSCQKDNLPSVGVGEEIEISVNAQLPNGLMTRSASSTLGDGSQIDRYIMEVYTNDGALYKRLVQDGGEFSLRLVTGQIYDFLFWADNSSTDLSDEYYDTDALETTLNGETVNYGLKQVAMIMDNGIHNGNNDERDAFFGNANDVKIESTTSINLDLKRPFGQLNVTTKLTDVREDFYPKMVKVSYSTQLPTVLNVETGEVSESKTVVWSESVAITDENSSNNSAITVANTLDLSTDYLFAPATDLQDAENLVNFTMAFYGEDGTTELLTANDKFVSIPVKRNYKTNVSGELLSKSGSITATLSPAFESEEINKEIVEIDVLVEEIQATITSSIPDADGDAISVLQLNVTEEVSSQTSITIPSTTNGGATEMIEAITLNFESTPTGEIIIGGEDDSESTYTGTITVNVPEGTSLDQLVINAPSAHVVINYGQYSTVVASTSNTTLEIPAGTVVESLIVESGNVALYGELQSIEKSATNTEETILTIYPGAIAPESIPEGIIVNRIDASVAIQNITTGISYESVKDAVLYANDGDVISLKDGEYPVPYDEGTENGKLFFLNITKSITIKGETNGGAKLYASTENNTGNWSGQNFITVQADNVTLQNLEIVGNYNGYYSGINKVIEVYSNSDNFTIDGCVITPNVKSNSGAGNDAGSLYIGTESTATMITATVKNTTFNNGAISARANAVVAVTGSTFNGIRPTAGWMTALSARGVINVSNSTFNVDAESVSGEEAIKAPGYGVVNVSSCQFPTSKPIYWSATDNGVVSVDGVNYYSQFFNITTEVSYSDFSNLINDAVAGDEVYVGAGQHTYYKVTNGVVNEATTSQIGKSITIYGANRGISGNSDYRGEETVILSSIYRAPTAPDIDIIVDGVELAESFTVNLEGGGNATIINSIFSATTSAAGSYPVNNRVFYCNGAKGTKGNFTLENNLFKPADENIENQIWIYGDKKDGSRVAVVVKNNTFVRTYLDFGTGSYTSDEDNSFVVEGNTFSDNSSYAIKIQSNIENATYGIYNNKFLNTPTAVWTYDSVVDALLSMSGNTFSGVETEIK